MQLTFSFPVGASYSSYIRPSVQYVQYYLYNKNTYICIYLQVPNRPTRKCIALSNINCKRLYVFFFISYSLRNLRCWFMLSFVCTKIILIELYRKILHIYNTKMYIHQSICCLILPVICKYEGMNEKFQVSGTQDLLKEFLTRINEYTE